VISDESVSRVLVGSRSSQGEPNAVQTYPEDPRYWISVLVYSVVSVDRLHHTPSEGSIVPYFDMWLLWLVFLRSGANPIRLVLAVTILNFLIPSVDGS
jgi:hypothetical protein